MTVKMNNDDKHEYILKRIKNLEENEQATAKRIDVIQACVISHEMTRKVIIFILSVLSIGLVIAATILTGWL